MKKHFGMKVISSLCSLALVAGMFGVGFAFAGEGDGSGEGSVETPDFEPADLSDYNVNPEDGKINAGFAPFTGPNGSGTVQGTIEHRGMWMLEFSSYFDSFCDENGNELSSEEREKYLTDKGYDFNKDVFWFTHFKKGERGSDGVLQETDSRLQLCINNMIAYFKSLGLKAEYVRCGGWDGPA